MAGLSREKADVLWWFFNRIILGIVEQLFLLDTIYYICSKYCYNLSVSVQKHYNLLCPHRKIPNIIAVKSFLRNFLSISMIS